MPGYLNRAFSGNLVKFFLANLDVVGNALVGITYLSNTDEDFKDLVNQFSIREITDFSTITRSVTSWKAILRSLSVHLSTSRELHGDIDQWIDEEDAGRVHIREVIKGFDKCIVVEDRTVLNGVKELSRSLGKVEDYIATKGNLGSSMKVALDVYSEAKRMVKDVADLVALGSLTREDGKKRCDEAMKAFEDLELSSVNLYNSAPEESIRTLVEAITGSQRGVGQFAMLVATLNTENYRGIVRYEEVGVRDKGDIQWLENEFATFCIHVTAYRKSMEAKEEKEQAVDLAITNLKKDIEETLILIFDRGIDINEKSVNELNHLQKRIDKLDSRLQEARDKSPKANFSIKVFLDGANVERSASSILVKAQGELTGVIGDKIESRKDEELKRKIELQSIERQAPSITLPDLKEPEDFLIWMSSYTPLRKNYKTFHLSLTFI